MSHDVFFIEAGQLQIRIVSHNVLCHESANSFNQAFHAVTLGRGTGVTTA
ncbi:MAG: hypothetical protein NVSMB43_24160 [Pseudarthrobacter sp.]